MSTIIVANEPAVYAAIDSAHSTSVDSAHRKSNDAAQCCPIVCSHEATQWAAIWFSILSAKFVTNGISVKPADHAAIREAVETAKRVSYCTAK